MRLSPITYLSKEGVLIGELVTAVEGYEELAGVIILAPIGHPHQPPSIELQTRVELILGGVVKRTGLAL